MDSEEKKNSLSDALLRDDFKRKLRSWFENKGINKKLESFLRSQMIVEFQNTCGSAINFTCSPSLSPKLQAVKLLVADFLVQENLLFSLSVFVSEVPFLNNLSSYTQYVKSLAQSQESTTIRPVKPKFSDANLCDLFDALNLNLRKEEIHILRSKYEVSNCNSLLVSLLSILPVLLKKHRNNENMLHKIRQKEKHYRKMVKTERAKMKQMYVLLKQAYSLVQNHKTEMNEALQKHDECKEHLVAVEKQLNDLTRRENELTVREKTVESKERAHEQKYAGKLREVEKKLKTLEEQDRELQCKYKILRDEQIRFENEKKQFEMTRSQVQITNTREIEKLEEYESKLSALQNQVLEIVKTCDQRNKQQLDPGRSNREIQCAFDTSNQSQQTESDTFINIEEYVSLIEKENAFLKLSGNKQRYRISQLANEVLALKNKLDYVENEMQIKKRLEHEERIQHVAHKLYFSSSPRDKFTDPSEVPSLTNGTSRSRRRLIFGEFQKSPVLGSESTESSSNSLSAANNLTDEIVADAKNKLKELEAESEMLNRNFKNLQSVLTRNMTFTEQPLAISSSVSDSSPNEKQQNCLHVRHPVNDLDNRNALTPPRVKSKSLCPSDFSESSPSSKTDPEISSNSPTSKRHRRLGAFSRIFQKYRQQKPVSSKDSRGCNQAFQSGQTDEKSSSMKQPGKQESAGENQLPNVELVTPNIKDNDEDDPVTDTNYLPKTMIVQDRSAVENAHFVKDNVNVAAVTDSIKQRVNQSMLDPKSMAENSGQSESVSHSNEIISAKVSNESSSSDFWK